MEKEILSVLKHFGWDESFHIPVANEKNKLLECRVEELLNKKIEATSLLADLTDDLKAIKDYYGIITEQRSQTEKILFDYKKQLETEQQIFNEIQYENNRVLKETEELTKTRKTLTEENEHKEAELEKLYIRSKTLQENINWCQEIEKYWNECVSKENRNVNILKEFNKADDAEFKKLELKRLQLVSEVKEYENILNRERDATISILNNLEKTSKIIDTLQEERSWLLNQWKSTGRILKVRSDGIDEIIREIDILKQVTRNNERKMLEYKNFYKEQIRNNMELEMEIRYIVRMTYKQQIQYEKTSQEAERKIDEESVKRRELMVLGQEVDQCRINNTITRRKINSLTEKIEELASNKETLKNKFNGIKDRSISLWDRIKQLENIYTNQKKEYNLFVKEKQKLATSVRANRHNINRTKDQLKIADNELKHLNNLFLKLKKSLSQQQNEKEKRSETLADIKQKIGKVKAEIDFMRGEKYYELKAEKGKRICELTKSLENKKKALDSILRDVNLSNSEMKRLDRNITLLLEIRDSLCQEKWNLKLMIEGGEKELTKLLETIKEKEVTENKLRLKANQLETVLSQNNEQVQLLEKEKINLETSLQERLLEIQNSTNVLKIRKKALQEEISTLHRNIDRINNHTSQLLKKYEIVIDSLEKDDMGQPLTLSNYKVELVKTRFYLLEKGDDLDEKIRKTEKEINAMENTLLLVDVTNNSLKNINTVVDDNGSQWEEKENLEKEYEEIVIRAKQLKKSIPEVSQIVESLRKTVAEKYNTQQEMLKRKKEKEMLASQLERDLEHQNAKLERVKIRLQNQKTRLKSMKQLASLERGFHLRELQNINKTALAQITELIATNNCLYTSLNTYLMVKGISLPAPVSLKKNTV